MSWKCWKINRSTTVLLYTLQLLLTVWDCGCSTHGPQVLCKLGLFRASRPRDVIACTANLLMLTIHAGIALHVQMVLSCMPQFSRFLPHDSSNHVSGKYLIIFSTSPRLPWSAQREDSLTFYSKLHPQAEAESCQKRITTSDRYLWHVMPANTLHSSAPTLPLQRSPGGVNWSHQCNSSTHLLAPSIGSLPAQGSQWWAPSEHARSHIQAVVELSVSQGMSSSLYMQEGVQWGQNL